MISSLRDGLTLSLCSELTTLYSMTDSNKGTSDLLTCCLAIYNMLLQLSKFLFLFSPSLLLHLLSHPTPLILSPPPFFFLDLSPPPFSFSLPGPSSPFLSSLPLSIPCPQSPPPPPPPPPLSLSFLLPPHLSLRGYSGKKLSDNVQCEIFQTILEEAKENYSDAIVHELSSNFPEDLERNIDALCQYIMEWTAS